MRSKIFFLAFTYSFAFANSTALKAKPLSEGIDKPNYSKGYKHQVGLSTYSCVSDPNRCKDSKSKK